MSLIEWFVRGQWTPAEYLRYCLRRIEDENPKINAVLEVYQEDAKAAAAAATRRFRARKPISFIDGIPIGIKANISMKGKACHGGIKAYENVLAPEDARVVRNLRSAGAVILCSLNMDEGGLGVATQNPWLGQTSNPLYEEFSVGGSSGGSAAALAGGIVPVTIGTDTMGGLRVPSASCGLVGHKPSHTLIPKDGVMPLSTSLDCVGPIVRHLEDAAIMLPIMAGTRRPFDLRNQDKARFACVHIPDDMDIEPEVKIAFDTLAGWLEEDNLMERTPDVLNDFDYLQMRKAGLLISEIEAAHFHLDGIETRPEGFSDYFAARLSWGAQQEIEKAKAAYAMMDAVKTTVQSLFTDADILLAPTTPQVPIKLGHSVPVNQEDFTILASFAGLPATTVPIGKGKNRLPIGVQIIGPVGRDEYTLQMAARIRELVQ